MIDHTSEVLKGGKYRVLVLATSFPTFKKGDATFPFVYELSRAMARDQLSAYAILTPWRKGAVAFENRDGLEIHRFRYGFSELSEGAILPNLRHKPLLWIQVPFFIVANFVAVIRLMIKFKPDIIHAHWIITQGFLACLCKALLRSDVKIVCTALGADIFSLQGFFARKLKKFTIENVDHIAIVSRGMQHEIERVSKVHAPISVIPTAADQHKFSPERKDLSIRSSYAPEGNLLLFVGRLAEKKGVQYIIEAMPYILKEHRNTKLVVIGDGPLRPDLEDRVRKLNLERNIIFLGPISNDRLPAYFASCDVFVAPSVIAHDKDSEGLPVVLLEAMLSGVCVVTSRLQVLTDIVKDNETAIQADVYDAFSFSQVINDVLVDGDRRTRIANAGRRAAMSAYTFDAISVSYRDIYKKLLQQ